MNKPKMVTGMVPQDVKTILDIGSEHNIYKNYETTTVDCIEKADINQDLNKNQILPFEDNSFDMVVANQILEHLADVDIIVKEMKRVSKKYLFIGLPNELTLRARLKFLFGTPDWRGYRPYHHKHIFTIKTIEEFMDKFFDGVIERKYYCAMTKKYIPNKLKIYLTNKFPKLFCKEVYYLFDTGKNR